MKIEDGILKCQLANNTRVITCKICPLEMRPIVIKDYHTASHCGITKTYQQIRLDWFWPNMIASIRRAVQQCEVCQAVKHSRKTSTSNRQRLHTGRPWQVLSLDLVGPFTSTPRGNNVILVLADHFTRWKDAIPIPDGTAENVAIALETRVFCYFGVPERIHTDQGAQFESRLMNQLCQIWGVKKSRTTPYHPEGNGIVERGNKDLGNSLRALLLHREETDWDLLLPQITRTWRATPNRTTGETANYLMLGRELSLPSTLISGPTERFQSLQVYAYRLDQLLQ